MSVSQHKDHEQAIQLQKLSKGAKEGEVQRTAADDNKERLLQVVKETVKTQLEVFNREKAKKEEEERYANTIKEIMYKTGKTVPPRAPRVYTIVRPREKKQKMREQINGIQPPPTHLLLFSTSLTSPIPFILSILTPLCRSTSSLLILNIQRYFCPNFTNTHQ